MSNYSCIYRLEDGSIEVIDLDAYLPEIMVGKAHIGTIKNDAFIKTILQEYPDIVTKWFEVSNAR
jgi:hypothetical protein